MKFDINGLLGAIGELPSVINRGLLGPLPVNPGLGLDPGQVDQARQAALNDMAFGMLASPTRNQGLNIALARGRSRENFSGRMIDLLREEEFARMRGERVKRQADEDAYISSLDPRVQQMARVAGPQYAAQAEIQAAMSPQSQEEWEVLPPEEVKRLDLDENSDWQRNRITKKIDKLFSPPAPGASATVVMPPGESEFAKAAAADNVARIRAASDTANAAASSLFAIRVASKGLPKAIVGTAAEARTGFAKLLSTAGLSSGQGLAATQQFLNATGTMAAQLLASKVFGAGTGISEKDLQFAIGLVGNDQTMTKEQIQRILAIREKMDRLSIQRYNDLRKTLGSVPEYAGHLGGYPEMVQPEPIMWVAPGTTVTD